MFKPELAKQEQYTSFDMACARELFEALDKHSLVTGRYRLSVWARDIRKLRTLDNVDEDVIVDMIEWLDAKGGSSYCPLVLSGSTLRKKRDQLRAAMRRDPVKAEVALSKQAKRLAGTDTQRAVHLQEWADETFAAITAMRVHRERARDDLRQAVWPFLEHAVNILSDYTSWKGRLKGKWGPAGAQFQSYVIEFQCAPDLDRDDLKRMES